MKRGLVRAWFGGTALGLLLGSIVLARLGARQAAQATPAPTSRRVSKPKKATSRQARQDAAASPTSRRKPSRAAAKPNGGPRSVH